MACSDLDVGSRTAYVGIVVSPLTHVKARDPRVV
jgi:hypothetical protein